MQQPGVGRENDVLRLYRGIERNPLQIPVATAPVLCATDRFSWISARVSQRDSDEHSNGSRRGTGGRGSPANRAQHLARKIVHVLEDQLSGYLQRRLTGASPADRVDTSSVRRWTVEVFK